jgi:hypothetical protein
MGDEPLPLALDVHQDVTASPKAEKGAGPADEQQLGQPPRLRAEAARFAWASAALRRRGDLERSRPNMRCSTAGTNWSRSTG